MNSSSKGYLFRVDLDLKYKLGIKKYFDNNCSCPQSSKAINITKYLTSVSAVGSATVTSPRSDHELARVLQVLL